MSSIILPVPFATQSKGLSAIYVGISVFCDIKASMFFIKAPPPANVIPLSTISDANSGGVFSNVALTKSIIFSISGAIAAWTSVAVIVLFSGNPVVNSLLDSNCF